MAKRKRFLFKNKVVRQVLLPRAENVTLHWSLLQLTFLERSYSSHLYGPFSLNSRQTYLNTSLGDKFFFKASGNAWGFLLVHPALSVGAALVYRNVLDSNLNYHRSISNSRTEIPRTFFYYWIFLGFRSAFFAAYGDTGRCLSVQNTVLFESVSATSYEKLSRVVRFLTLLDVFWTGSFLAFLPLNAPPVFRSFHSTAYPFFVVASTVGSSFTVVGFLSKLKWVQSTLQIVNGGSFSEINYLFFPDHHTSASDGRGAILNLKRIAGVGEPTSGSKFKTHQNSFNAISDEINSMEFEAEEDFWAEFEEVDEYETDFDFNKPASLNLDGPSGRVSIINMRWTFLLRRKFWSRAFVLTIVKFLALSTTPYLHFTRTSPLIVFFRSRNFGVAFLSSTAVITFLKHFNYNNITKPYKLLTFLLYTAFVHFYLGLLFFLTFFRTQYVGNATFIRVFKFFLKKFNSYLFSINIFKSIFFYDTYVKLQVISYFFFRLSSATSYLVATFFWFCKNRLPKSFLGAASFTRKFTLSSLKLAVFTFILFTTLSTLQGLVIVLIALLTIDLLLHVLKKFFYIPQSLSYRPLTGVFNLIGDFGVKRYLVILGNFIRLFTCLVVFKSWNWLFYLSKRFSRIANRAPSAYYFNVKPRLLKSPPLRPLIYLFFRLNFRKWILFWCSTNYARMWSGSLVCARLLSSPNSSLLFWLYFSGILTGFGSFGWWVDSDKDDLSGVYLRARYMAHLLQNNLLVAYHTSFNTAANGAVMTLYLLFLEIFSVRGWLKPWGFAETFSNSSQCFVIFFERYRADLMAENFLSRILASKEFLPSGKRFSYQNTRLDVNKPPLVTSINLALGYFRNCFWLFWRISFFTLSLVLLFTFYCVRVLYYCTLFSLFLVLVLALLLLLFSFIGGILPPLLFSLAYTLINLSLLYFFVSRATYLFLALK